MLTTASIIGREFYFRLVISLNGDVSEDQLLRAVDEAVSAQLIEDVRGQMDRYQFSHALVQQTLAEEVITSRRVRLHARIAEALEHLYGDATEVHAVELAHHFAEAQTSTGITKLVRYSLLAGEQALAAYAYEDAITHFDRAVAAAEFRIGSQAHRIPGAGELLARALALVAADSHEAGRLLSRYGVILGAVVDYEGGSTGPGSGDRHRPVGGRRGLGGADPERSR